MADSTSGLPPQVAEAKYFIFVTQIFFCCMYSVVVWDWFVCIPREYKYIWKSRWTAVKCSYLFCRYWVLTVVPFILFVFVTNHSAEKCNTLFRYPVALATWNQAGAEVVLLIRTYAFFNRNIYILVLLCMGLGGVLSYQLYVIIAQMIPLPFIAADTGPCLPQSRPHSAHILGFFMASLAFDASVTVMTLYKAFQLRRTYGPTTSPLVQTFLREGIFYFVLISIANLVNGIFYLQPRQAMSAINIPLSIMFADVLACRMILDLRERGYEISQPTNNTPSIPLHIPLSNRTGGHGNNLDFRDCVVSDGTQQTASSSTTNSKDAGSPIKSPTSPGLPSLSFSFSRRERVPGAGLRDGRITPGSVLTTTIGSSIFARTQTSYGSVPPVDLSSRGTVGTEALRLDTRRSDSDERELHASDGGNNVELKSFVSRYDMNEEERDRQEKLSPIGEESPVSPGIRMSLNDYRTQMVPPPAAEHSDEREGVEVSRVNGDGEKASS